MILIVIFTLSLANLNAQSGDTSTLGTDQAEIEPASVELSIESDQIEFGNNIVINYGILAANGSYVSNISQQLYFVEINETEFDSSLHLNDSFLIFNNTSVPLLSQVSISTIDPSFGPIKPGVFTVYYTTSIVNGTNYNATAEFEVFPQQGSKIEIVFSSLPSNVAVTSPITLPIGITRLYQLTIINLGDGNALDINLEVEGINGPHQYDSSDTPFRTDILGPLQQESMSFSISSPQYGIGEVRFVLKYNNTLLKTTLLSETLQFYTIPTITAEILGPNSINFDQNGEWQITINNRFDTSVLAKFALVSPLISFNPAETIFSSLNRGNTSFLFNGIPYSNGTGTITLYMTYLDPVGNDQLVIPISSLRITVYAVSSEGGQRISPFTIISFILYVLLFSFIFAIYFNKSVRRFILTKLFKEPLAPDLDFENRKIIVDGSNVAWESLDENRRPQIENIELAISTLESYGFNEIVVVADAALRHQLSEKSNFDEASQRGIIKVLPAKVDGDSFILRLARDLGALILTNDLYKEYRKEFPWVDNRRIPFSILNGKFYLHPIYDL